ncbi:hypothetical protein PENTCL1PPCAC_17802, partial [Pristionchus entomophagus]
LQIGCGMDPSPIYSTTTFVYPHALRTRHIRRPQSLLLTNDLTQYDELKKILILSGIFFMGTIILIMSKMQMQTEEVLRWSPIVWLLGVIIAGLTCNGIFYCRKLCVKRRRNRHPNPRDLYSTLPLPISYPCLAPPPHEGCCRDSSPYSYRTLPLLPPSYHESIQEEGNRMVPPKYEEIVSPPLPS